MIFHSLRKFLFCFLLFNISVHSQAQTRILFVGNSYTYYHEMPEMVRKLAEVNGVTVEIMSAVNGGVSLKDHWEENRGLQTKTLIENGSYDFVVIQDQSLTPLNKPDQTITYGKILTELIKSKGGAVVIFQTWSRKGKPQMQVQLDKTYAELSEKTGARIAPVARSWHKAFEEFPDLELYDYDGSHPSEIGSYLAALVIYKTVFDLADLQSVKTIQSERWSKIEMQQCEWIAHTTGSF